MPSKRSRKRGKTSKDPEVARLKRMVADPDNAVPVRHGMFVPVLKLFCAVFVELAACSSWTRRDLVVGRDEPDHMLAFADMCMDTLHNELTASALTDLCRRFWHRMVNRPPVLVRDFGRVDLLWQQIREMGTLNASARVMGVNIVLASGLHRRLGEGSPVMCLGTDLVRMIAAMVRPEGMVLWVDALFGM